MKKKVLYVIVMTIIVVPIVLLLASLELSNGLPWRILMVQTGSMSPSYPAGSAVFVNVHEPRPGEPISFYQHNTIITHRWVSTNADGTVQTKGDANETPDTSSVDKADIIGGVMFDVPYAGYVIKYLTYPPGYGSLFFALLAFLLLWPLLREPEESAESTSVQAA